MPPEAGWATTLGTVELGVAPVAATDPAAGVPEGVAGRLGSAGVVLSADSVAFGTAPNTFAPKRGKELKVALCVSAGNCGEV
jgi:hypothetical protein